jgi:hypothetical protein
LIVTTWGGYWHLEGRGWDVAKHLTVHREAPKKGLALMPTVRRLRHLPQRGVLGSCSPDFSLIFLMPPLLDMFLKVLVQRHGTPNKGLEGVIIFF